MQDDTTDTREGVPDLSAPDTSLATSGPVAPVAASATEQQPGATDRPAAVPAAATLTDEDGDALRRLPPVESVLQELIDLAHMSGKDQAANWAPVLSDAAKLIAALREDSRARFEAEEAAYKASERAKQRRVEVLAVVCSVAASAGSTMNTSGIIAKAEGLLGAVDALLVREVLAQG